MSVYEVFLSLFKFVEVIFFFHVENGVSEVAFQKEVQFN